MRTWPAEPSPNPAGPLFPTQPGGQLSRDAVERLVAKHAATAADTCPSIKNKHVTPHTLRHSAAMPPTGFAAGAPMKLVADVLGHASESFTSDVYAVVADELAEQAAVAIADFVPRRKRPRAA